MRIQNFIFLHFQFRIRLSKNACLTILMPTPAITGYMRIAIIRIRPSLSHTSQGILEMKNIANLVVMASRELGASTGSMNQVSPFVHSTKSLMCTLLAQPSMALKNLITGTALQVNSLKSLSLQFKNSSYFNDEHLFLIFNLILFLQKPD